MGTEEEIKEVDVKLWDHGPIVITTCDACGKPQPCRVSYGYDLGETDDYECTVCGDAWGEY